MRKIAKNVNEYLMVFILVSSAIFMSGCLWDSSTNRKSEGVQSLVIYLERDIDNFNYTNAGVNLINYGYTPEIKGKGDEYDWYIQIKWSVSDEEYAEKYTSNLTVTLYGFEPSNSSEAKSYILVGFGSVIMADGTAKKEKDKELAKQAAYEFASIVNVPLDWERHDYTISWMTMTSEGISHEE